MIISHVWTDDGSHIINSPMLASIADIPKTDDDPVTGSDTLQIKICFCHSIGNQLTVHSNSNTRNQIEWCSLPERGNDQRSGSLGIVGGLGTSIPLV